MRIDSLTLVSTSAAGGQGNGSSTGSSLSADGRFVVFEGFAANLVSGDTNGAPDVFVRDLQTGAVSSVSSNAGGGHGNGWSYAASISADGRFVAFTSSATNLEALAKSPLPAAIAPAANVDQVPSAPALITSVMGRTHVLSLSPVIEQLQQVLQGGPQGLPPKGKAPVGPLEETHIFLKDLQTGAVTQVTTNAAGVDANGNSVATSISADGRFVAFRSDATNLVPGDTNQATDIFVKDVKTGTVTRVSTSTAGAEADGSSYTLSISADGRFVAFDSFATNLVPGDTNRTSDVFVRDMHTGKVTRVSTDAAGHQGDGMSSQAAISADGRFVAFQSNASNLVPVDTNRASDIFVKDLLTGALRRVSTDAADGQAAGHSHAPSISADGRFVAFESNALNWVPGGWPQQIVVKDLQTGLAAVVSTSATGWQANWHCSAPSLSADGRTVSFESGAGNLVPGDHNAARDVFVTVNPLSAPGGGYKSVALTAGADTFAGTAANDRVEGLGGDDSLAGMAGNDILIGGAGNDTLWGGAGADLLAGGAGDDVYCVDARDYITGELAGGGTDRVYSSSSFRLADTLENLYLTGGAAAVGTGNQANNVIGGNSAGNWLFGLGGNDKLYGNGGNDTLRGGAGSDTLKGGAGADRFDFNGGHSSDGRADHDVIADYSRAAGDVVDIPGDPATGYAVVGVVGGALQIRLAGGNDIIEFTGISSAADILFV